MLVTAMDINVTIINNNAGNGDGYKRDNKHFKYIHIYFTPIIIIITKKAMLVTAMDINVTLDNIKKIQNY
jgi:hypothetical protein